MTTRSSVADQIARRYYRAREGNVVAFPGTMSHYTTRGGEFKWHCPLAGCYQSGRWVKRFSTASRGLAKHVEECHR